jgi:hypothetical protein
VPVPVPPETASNTLGWPDANIVSGDAVDIVTRLKEESDIPLRSQASLSLNWALMAHDRRHERKLLIVILSPVRNRSLRRRAPTMGADRPTKSVLGLLAVSIVGLIDVDHDVLDRARPGS